MMKFFGCPRGVKLSMCGPLLAMLALVAGCGGDSQSAGTVTGTVTLENRPVADASVILFSSQTGQSASAPLDSQGQFAIRDRLPLGDYVVTIVPNPVEENPGSEEPPPPASVSPVPDKYASDTTSDLRVQLSSGKNEFNWELQP